MTKKEKQIIIDKYQKLVEKEHRLWLGIDDIGDEDHPKVRRWAELMEAEEVLESLMRKLGFNHITFELYKPIVDSINKSSED